MPPPPPPPPPPKSAQQTSPPVQFELPSQETDAPPVQAPMATHDSVAPPPAASGPPPPAIAQQTCVAALHVAFMPQLIVPVAPPSLVVVPVSLALSKVSALSAPPSVVAVPSLPPPASVAGDPPSLVDPPHATANATALEIPIVTSRRP
jgi:hypothetical protein